MRVTAPHDRVARSSVLACTALIGSLAGLASGATGTWAATLNLDGANRTLPVLPYFAGQRFLNGTDNVTNNPGAGGGAARLTEGGAPAGTTYTGLISDGTAATGIVQTSGKLTLGGTNTFSGGLVINGGTVATGATNALGSAANAVTVNGASALLNILAGSSQQVGTVTIKAGGATVSGSLTANAVDVTGTAATVRVATTGAVDASLRNAGAIQNTGTWTGAVLANSGTIGNAPAQGANTGGAWTGDVASNTGMIGNAGTWTGSVTTNAGTIGNATLWQGAVASNTGVIGNAGTWVGAITNAGAGTVFNGGVITGALTNAGTFDALGLATPQGPAAGALPPLQASVIEGTVTNTGTFNVVAPTTIQATQFFPSTAPFNGLSYSTDGASATAGDFNNAGTLAVAPGATLTVGGTLTNGANGLITDAGTLNGAILNRGTFAALGTAGRVGGTLTNAGTLDLSQGGGINALAAANYVGQPGSQLVVNVDLRGAGTSPTAGRASLLTLQSASGSTVIDFKGIGGQGTAAFYPSIPVVAVASGATGVFTADQASLSALGNGLVSYGFAGGALQGSVRPSAATVAGVQTTTTLTTLNTQFFQDWQPFERQAFVTAPQDPAANTISGGPWVRGKYGNDTDTAVSTAGGVSAVTRVASEYSGFQTGGDVGVFNINGTGWNLLGGVTGGEFFSHSVDQVGGATTGNFEIPYVGAYVAATRGPFFVDLLYHHDFYGLKLSDATTGLSDQGVSGNGDTLHIDSAYTVALGDYGKFGNLFVTPSGSLVLSRVDLNALPFTALNLGSVRYDPIDSTLGRLGLRFGSNFVTPTLALQPFISANVWHEFEGNTTSEFDALSGVAIPISTSRVGTFGQAGLGLNGELLGKNLLGTVKADFDFGDRVNGESVTAQLRYQF